MRESTKSLKQTIKFTKTAIEGLQPASGRQNVYDETVPGLAVRVSPSGRKSFYYSYRLPGMGRNATSQRIHLGAFPVMSVEQARLKARQLAAQVVNGQDPAQERQKDKEAQSLAEVMDLFMAEHVKPKLKPKSVELYELAIRKHIKPTLGKRKVEEITHRDIAKLHHRLKEIPYMANRAAGVLSSFFGWAGKNGFCERKHNPVEGLDKLREEKKQTFLTADQIGALLAALDTLEKGGTIDPIPAAALRLLIFTGMRLREALSLKWKYLDLEAETAALPDSKTGFKKLELSAEALDILKALKAMPFSSDYVFPSITSASGHMEGLRKPWGLLQAKAGLKEHWRIHDLRHAFASAMVASGASLPIVGKILGHSQAATTERYAHVEKSPAKKAADDAAQLIAERWNKASETAASEAESKAPASVH